MGTAHQWFSDSDRLCAFWRPLIETDGQLDRAKIMNELSDYSRLMRQASTVYQYVTGDALGKPHYDAATVISYADRYREEHERHLAEELVELLRAEGHTAAADYVAAHRGLPVTVPPAADETTTSSPDRAQ